MSDITWQVVIDWDANGNFTGTYDDVSADVLSLSGAGGRSSANDVVGAATCEIVLENPSGRYNRDNATSPIYGLMLPGREVEVRATFLAVTYVQFRGRLSELDEGLSEGSIPTVLVSCVDGFDELGRKELKTALSESKRVDELIATVLDAASWPAGRRTLDTGLSTLDRWWSYRGFATGALQDLGRSELGGGLVYIRRDGNVRFENRDYRSAVASYATVTNPIGSLRRGTRFSDLVEKVQLTRGGLALDTAVTVLWSLSPGGRKLMPGSSDPLNTIDFKLAAGGKALVSPVPLTDYQANSDPAGAGTDKTAQVTVSSFTAYGGGGRIVFANADSSPVYLYGAPHLQVRGQAIRRSDEDLITEVTAAAPIASGQVLAPAAYEWVDDANLVMGQANLLAAVMSQDRPRPAFSLPAQTDAEIIVALGIDVSKRLTMNVTAGLYNAYLTGDYIVEAYRWSAIPDENMVVDVVCWSEDQALATGFIVSSDGGAAISLIAADGATSGFDRIWV